MASEYHEIAKNKKNLSKVLTSAAILAVFVAAAPAFADINGGANTPGAYDSADAYNNQTEFVSARTVKEYLNGHASEIAAKADAGSGLSAAKSAREAFDGSSEAFTMNSQDRLAKIAELDAAVASAQAKYNTEYNNIRNQYVEQFQKVQNTAKKEEGNFYKLNEKPEDKNKRYKEEHGVKSADQNNNGGQTDNTKPADGKTAPTQEQTDKVKADAKKTAKAVAKTTAGKTATKSGAKTLPNTAAVK